MKAMTRGEASQEAYRRWGAFARSFGCTTGTSPKSFSVGILLGRDMWVLGKGASWEEAFQDADKRKPPNESSFTRWRSRVMGFRGSV
jgi:hypothetical protein